MTYIRENSESLDDDVHYQRTHINTLTVTLSLSLQVAINPV